MKEYKGWEIVKMVSEGALNNNAIVKKVVDSDGTRTIGERLFYADEYCLWDDKEKEFEPGNSFFADNKSRFVIAQKPVSFYEAAASGKNIRVVKKDLSLETGYVPFVTLIKIIASFSDFAADEIIQKGEFYIKD